MISPRKPERQSLARMIERIDMQPVGAPAPDTVPSGFPSLDRRLGGGFRQQDLIVLGGDVGSGKSSLALGIALRVAGSGFPVSFISGEMDHERLMERALAIEGRSEIDALRRASVSEEKRASIGAAAWGLQDIPLRVHSMEGPALEEIVDPAWDDDPALVVIDYLQLLRPPVPKLSQAEDDAGTLRALKNMALKRRVPILLLAQLPDLNVTRPDPRPTLEDFGTLGAVKQHADTVLCIFREEMYRNDSGLDGATELIVAKNRNGPTGFVDLYFYKQWMRFEDMVDPDR